MLILPERNLPKGRILLPQKPREWRQPSQRTSTFGIENKTRFCLTGRVDDGYIVWRGWFDDREDVDEFLYSLISGSLQYERELWRLPSPWWDIGYIDLGYEFSTVRFLTSTSSTNQTDTYPTDWDNNNNHVEVIASGGSGGAATGDGSNDNCASGGGGGGYSLQNNITLTSGTATFHLEAGATAVSQVGNGVTNGNAGGDCWYNGTTLAGSSVGAKGGGAGQTSTGGGTAASAAGGAAGSGIGTTKHSGGASGTAGTAKAASGGGGAAGSTSNGNASANAGTNAATAGGSGDAGLGGAGGAGNTSGNGGTGGNGAEYDASHGSGGGGGAGRNSSAVAGGAGGNYGAGGGGSANTNAATATSGSGNQALIIITYTPLVPIFFDYSPAVFRKKRGVAY